MPLTSALLPSSDRALARRIETADAEAMRALLPGATVEAHAGGICAFAGAGSPVTHTMGIGMAGAMSEADLDAIEHFFHSRGAACVIDLCPLADESLISMVQRRNYRVVELNNVLIRTVNRKDDFARAERVWPVTGDDGKVWQHVVAKGFAEGAEPDRQVLEMLAPTTRLTPCFLAGENGVAEAGAAMGIADGVASFFGDATLPEARGRGLQLELIYARLKHAARRGCDLACAAVLPGSGSHRNYERAGFQLLYMRVNVARETPATSRESSCWLPASPSA